MILDQQTEVIRLLGELTAKMENVERAVMGNGQPGLSQRVANLEESRARMWGAGGVLTFIAALAEYFFHRK